MLDQLQGFHIEPTNMCTLKCPRCARTKFIENFPKQWTNKNLNLDHLKNFLDIDLTGKHISLCGNYGDPIYYDDLFDLITFFKKNNAVISLSTNGSYRTAEWWNKLVSIMDSRDKIIFGIDGVSDNFTQYRVNADWDSIKLAIDIVAKSSVKSHWQYIPFSFNENNIDEAQQLAMDLGIDKFYILPSDRFDSDKDWLRPSNENTNRRDSSIIEWKNGYKNNEIDPKCTKNHNEHYISADGYYVPCCFVDDYRFYYKTEFFKNRELYDISKTTITKVLDNLKDFYSTLEDAKLNYCTFNCPKL